MQVQEMATATAPATEVAQYRLCPECGTVMLESERLIEGNSTFVWYECSKDGCDGQWLAKLPTR